ncbi:MAG: PQQ-binding-like beta-propeller repeat protein [Planctomycetes bacterium]|nr:PQQ-binding-like beta-propeller repeat protein [Planctomycetota bacterium]
MKTLLLLVLPLALAALLLLSAAARADDWPQWRGQDRDGVWRETGILDAIPADGLKVRWRARIGLGYSGPVVAGGRVFVTDRRLRPEVERVLCFDEVTGKPLWVHAYPCDYENMDYGSGPRASPMVDEGKIYSLGAKGQLVCLEAAKGKVIWERSLVKDYAAQVPRWGASAAPLVEGELLIACVGGQPGACIVAFDKKTGLEVWKALDDRPAYSAPLGIEAGGERQVVIRTADAVNSLEPATGKVYWRIPWKMPDGYYVIASPVRHGDRLLFLSYGRGGKMLKLDASQPGASVLWETRSKPDAGMSSPLLDDHHFYAVNGQGELYGADASTGEELWNTREPTSSTPLGNAHLTPNGDRVFLFNQKGHLILSRVTARGYQEIGRSLLIEPTAGVRAQGPVTWAHPAFANKHIFARNDRELVSVSLAADQAATADAPEPKPVAKARILANAANGQSVSALALSPDGRTLALGLWAGTIKVLDLSTGKELPAPTRHRHWVNSLAFSHDGKLLASAGGNEFLKYGEVKLWDVAAAAERGQLNGHADNVMSVVFSPDSKTLATGSADQTVILWDVAAGKQRFSFKGHSDAVWSVAISSDGNTVASASWDRTVRLWDANGGEERGQLAGHEEEILAVAISPDSKTLASGGADWTVRLWDTAARTERAVLKGHQGAVNRLVFSSDGKTLATGSGDETIKLWDAATGAERTTLRGHRSGITGVAFSPDDKMLVSAAMEDAIRLWKLPPEK